MKREEKKKGPSPIRMPPREKTPPKKRMTCSTGRENLFCSLLLNPGGEKEKKNHSRDPAKNKKRTGGDQEEDGTRTRAVPGKRAPPGSSSTLKRKKEN